VDSRAEHFFFWKSWWGFLCFLIEVRLFPSWAAVVFCFA
jgi:hypothetical protein